MVSINSIKQVLLVIISVCNALVFIFSSGVFYNATLFGLGMVSTLICSMVALVLSAFERGKQGYVLSVIFMFLAGIFSWWLHPSGSFGPFLISLLGYTAIPSFMCCLYNTVITEKLKSWLRRISVLYLFVFVFLAFYKPIYWGQTMLSLGYSNPNRAGTYMMLVFIMILLLFQDVMRPLKKALVVFLLAALMSVIMMTQCRTAFIISLICAIFMIVPKRFIVKKKYTAICMAAPLLFSSIYMALYNSGKFSEVTLLNKTIFSGRQSTFLSEYISFSVFGDFERLGFGGLNIATCVISSFGIVGAILFFCNYWKFFSNLFKRRELYNSKNLNYAIFCLSTVILHGCTETDLFVGGGAYAGLFACIVASAGIVQDDDIVSKPERNDRI